MAVNVIVKALLGVELFQGLRPLQITEIARRADRIVYRPGDVIIECEAHGDAAILIIEGVAVRLAATSELGAASEPIPAGSLLGEMAMLIETEHSSTIIARTTVRALRINRTELHAQMADDQSLADHLVQRIAERLNSIASALRAIDDRMERQSTPLLSAFAIDAGNAHMAGANLAPPRQPAIH